MKNEKQQKKRRIGTAAGPQFYRAVPQPSMFLCSERKQMGCNIKIYQDGAGVHQGGDQGSRHDGRVQADLFCQQRQTAAYDFCKNDRGYEGKPDKHGHSEAVVHEHDTQSIDCSQHKAN